MAPLTSCQQKLFNILVEAVNVADHSTAPDFALATRFGPDQMPSSKDINRVSGNVRSAVQFLHQRNPEGFREATEAQGGSFASMMDAIFEQTADSNVKATADRT
ncbi:MAG: hypothetical protein PHX93_05480 [Candidatus Peribacteraceae bacterium]|jgi:hypothetical protein|nr:hypothetical protein [Candidatus Peribacteraceae bacterium]